MVVDGDGDDGGEWRITRSESEMVLEILNFGSLYVMVFDFFIHSMMFPNFILICNVISELDINI